MSRLATAVRRSVSDAAPALAGYLAARAVGIGVLLVWSARVGADPLWQLTSRSDAAWYLGIARYGYDDGAGQSNRAFFPLYPALTGLLGRLTGWTAPGLVVAALGSLLAAWGIFAVTRLVAGRRTAVITTVLWALVPSGVVQTMGYSEGPFTAFAAWSLYALLRRHWLAAGVLCLLAGLTRPTGGALAVVVVLACLAAVRSGEWRRPVLGACLAPLGVAGYLAWTASALGSPDAWFRVQREGWLMGFDGGRATVEDLALVLAEGTQLAPKVVAVTLLATPLLLVALAIVLLGPPARSLRGARWAAWPVVAYPALVLAQTVGADGYFHAKARFLVPAFALVVPVAWWLARRPRPVAWLVLAALTALAAWYGGYQLLVWPRSP